MSDMDMMAPQGQTGAIEKTPGRPEISLTQQFSGYQMSHRPDEKITADGVRALSLLVGPLDEVENLEIKQAELEENLKCKGSPVQGIIGAVSALVGLGMVFIPILIAEASGSGTGSMTCLVCMGLILGIIGFITAIKGLGDYSTKSSRYKRAEKELPQIYARLNQLKTDVDWQAITMMPPVYRNVDALSFTCVSFINGRATTIQEAVNLYEQELHNLKMQNMAAATMQAAENARVSANKAAVSSAVSAGFSAMKLFF